MSCGVYPALLRTGDNTTSPYRCIPHDKRRPECRIAYRIPHELSKVKTDRFVLLEEVSGKLHNVLGLVTDLDAALAYQVYCEGQQLGIRLPRVVLPQEEEKGEGEETTTPIFTIDPDCCVDRDDALSIRQVDEYTWCVSVYITNVSHWFSLHPEWVPLMLDSCVRVSTLYLPNKRWPLFPSWFTSRYCSLNQGEGYKPVWYTTCRVTWCPETRSHHVCYEEDDWKTGWVRIDCNATYSSVVDYPPYRMLASCTPGNLTCSEEVVKYWMTLCHVIGTSPMRRRYDVYRQCVRLEVCAPGLLLEECERMQQRRNKRMQKRCELIHALFQYESKSMKVPVRVLCYLDEPGGERGEDSVECEEEEEEEEEEEDEEEEEEEEEEEDALKPMIPIVKRRMLVEDASGVRYVLLSGLCGVDVFPLLLLYVRGVLCMRVGTAL